jgi:hypothetical protein
MAIEMEHPAGDLSPGGAGQAIEPNVIVLVEDSGGAKAISVLSQQGAQACELG